MRAGREEGDHAAAYLLMRLTFGAGLCGHGLVRLPKLAAFHAQLMGEFKAWILPAIVLVFGATSIEHFNVIGEQLVHTIFLAAVVAFRCGNTYSVDHLLTDRKSLSV